MDSLLLDFAPWRFPTEANSQQQTANDTRIAGLRAAGAQVGAGCFVSRLAAVDPESLQLGDRSYVAAHCQVTDQVVIGTDCSVNVGVALRGRVRIGDGVRIGSRASLLGFNHGFDRLDLPIRSQAHTSRGVWVGDDVWLGNQAIVLDGVRIGSHAVVGAGAVVTRDVPEYGVAVGNPARVIRDRRSGWASATTPADPLGRVGFFDGGGLPDGAPVSEGAKLSDGAGPTLVGRAPDPADPTTCHIHDGPGRNDAQLVRDLAGWVRRDLPGIIEASRQAGVFVDAPGGRPTVRAHCDVIELANLIGMLPGEETGADTQDDQTAATLCGLSRAEHIAALARRFPTPAATGNWPGADQLAYHILCVGYALRLLGYPPTNVPFAQQPPGEILAALAQLPWQRNAWGAGAAVDTLGTAYTFAAGSASQPPVATGAREALIGWLLEHRDPRTGLWGQPRPSDGYREPLNGTYRLVRGTFAQWGLPLGLGVQLTDTVLAHANTGVLAPQAVTACDALDVIYLLWWARQSADHRSPEVAALASQMLRSIADCWSPAGLAFAPGASPSEPGSTVSGVPDGSPTLQGSEMWLAVAWYAADLLGVAAEFGWTPRGVHNPHPIGDFSGERDPQPRA